MPAIHTLGSTVLRRRSTSEFFKNPIELRQRLKADSERDFADSQMLILQEFARFLGPRLSDVMNKVYTGHLFELFAQMIGADIYCFRYFGKRNLFARMLADKNSRFPDLHRFGSISGAGVFKFSC